MEPDYVKFIQFVRYCNEQTFNENEYIIADVLFRHIGDLHTMTITDIAEEANISVASVSRMIKKMGFSSLTDFRVEMENNRNNYKHLMWMFYMKKFYDKSFEQLSDTLIEEAIDNLKGTTQVLNKEAFNTLIDMIFSSESISLLGDTREVRTFFTFQLSMMMLNKPVYAFTNQSIAMKHELTKRENSLAIFFVVAEEWFNESWKSILRKAKKNGKKIAIFTQDTLPFEKEVDLVIHYGVPGSHNRGYYSLSFINDLLHMMILNKSDHLQNM